MKFKEKLRLRKLREDYFIKHGRWPDRWIESKPGKRRSVVIMGGYNTVSR